MKELSYEINITYIRKLNIMCEIMENYEIIMKNVQLYIFIHKILQVWKFEKNNYFVILMNFFDIVLI